MASCKFLPLQSIAIIRGQFAPQYYPGRSLRLKAQIYISSKPFIMSNKSADYCQSYVNCPDVQNISDSLKINLGPAWVHSNCKICVGRIAAFIRARLPQTHIYNTNPENDKLINSRRVSGDELVAVLQRGQGPDGAILGVQYLELEAALVGVGQTPGHIEVGASL